MKNTDKNLNFMDEDMLIEQPNIPVEFQENAPFLHFYCQVTVTGDPSSDEDSAIPGNYDFQVIFNRPVFIFSMTDEEKEEVATKILDSFHDHFGIDCLDDFTIDVTMANGQEITQGESSFVDALVADVIYCD